MKKVGLGLGVGAIAIAQMQGAIALPPPEDTPEEVLRNEIILDARSPLDGEPLTAAEYAQLQEALSQPQEFVDIDPELEQLIFLLRIRKFVKTLIPFIDI